MKDLTCFISQKAFIEKDGELLLLHDPQIGVELPGGKVLENETDLRMSLQREVIEETGLIIDIGKPFHTWLYTIPSDIGHRSAGKRFLCVGYRCTYVSGDIKLSSEHDWYKWVNKDNYKEYCKTNFSDVLGVYFENINISM